MSRMIRQGSFALGEVDAINFKRTNLSWYLKAAQALTNCEVGTTELCRKRKGTQFIAGVDPYASTFSQLMFIQDKNLNFYLLIFKDLQVNIFQEDGTFIQSIVTPYVEADLSALKTTQFNDSIVIAHRNYPSARIYVSDYVPLIPVFSYQALDIYPQPAYDFGNINYNNFSVVLSVSGNVLTFQFVGLSADPGFTSAWVGGAIIGGGASQFAPIGYAIITNVGPYAAGTVTFTGIIQIPFETVNYATTGNQYSITQPVFTAALGYPACVAFFQNRLFFAGTKSLPSTVFGSKINAPTNFDAGVGRDTDALIYAVGQNDSGAILALNGGKQLEIYTENYEFVAPQDQNNALTPSTFSIRQQSAYGVLAESQPFPFANDSFYISRSGNAIINFRFNGIGQSYSSTNISLQATHLVKSPTSHALLRGDNNSDSNFIYYLNNDKTLTAFQFANNFKLAALTPIIFNSDTEVIDIQAVNNKVYFLKRYVLTNKFAIEKFTIDVKLDSYQTVTIADGGLVTGLDMLDGYTVQVYFNNQDFGEYEVIGGQILVEDVTTGGEAFVGLNYDVVITPMFLYDGPNQADFFKNISRIYVDYFESLDFYVNGQLVNFQIFQDIMNEIPLQPQSGTAIADSADGWNRDSTFSITQRSPFDLVITAISYQIDSALI